MLRPGELARMREVGTTNFDKTCTIVRLTLVPDGMGGSTETWAEIESVPCAIAPRGGAGEDDEDSVVRGRSSLVLTLAHDVEILTTDRVTVDERTFEVLDVHLRTYQVTKRVELAEVT